MTELPLETILSLVRTRTGWELRDEDGSRLRDKLMGRLNAFRKTPAHYLERLEAEPQGAEWSELLALLSNPETYFFRDSRQIALLKDRILAELLERRRPHRSLRIWSAGCSTGEEAYSLAFLLQELAPDLASWDVLILGTDVNPLSIEKAREGRYREWSFRGRHAKLDRYFNCEGDTWRVKDHLRRMVTFRPGNLVDDRFPDARAEIREMDLIVCRNVFIYFSRPAVSRVVAKMAATLRPGGFLLTGHTELHGVALPQLPLQPRRFGDSLAYQHGPPPGAPKRAPSPEPGRLRADAAHAPPQRVPRAPRPVELPSQPNLPATAEPEGAVPFAHADAARLLEEGRYQVVLEKLREHLTASPDDLSALGLAVRAAANMDSHEWAVEACRRALEHVEFAPEPYYLLAQIAEEQGRLSEAKELLKKSMYVSPQFVPAYLELAAVYERERNAVRAAKMRAAALELLRAEPADAVVAGCETALAGELAAQLEERLSRTEQPV